MTLSKEKINALVKDLTVQGNEFYTSLANVLRSNSVAVLRTIEARIETTRSDVDVVTVVDGRIQSCPVVESEDEKRSIVIIVKADAKWPAVYGSDTKVTAYALEANDALKTFKKLVRDEIGKWVTAKFVVENNVEDVSVGECEVVEGSAWSFTELPYLSDPEAHGHITVSVRIDLQ